MSTPRLLLADDDPDFVKMLETALQKESWKLETTSQGTVALEMVKKGGYDLILLDILMPDLNGITLLKNLQSEPLKPTNGPIIMLTALSEDEFVQSCLELGATGYINKATTPFPDLINQIKSFLAPK